MLIHTYDDHDQSVFSLKSRKISGINKYVCFLNMKKKTKVYTYRKLK